ncbi:MAG: class I SAM-dependent RNA methyltransferase, partial [Leptospiraceae bacterium]|nr:class I SAM-dependent RNA methyltransferase [Leptospiraceae bacterium]
MVVLKSEKWVHGGYTIAHANDMVYFIKGAIPGEIVECEIIQEKKDHNFALVKTIIEKSNSRIENKCSSFPICGGCSFLQISYEDELKLKLNLLKTELENKNIIFPEIKIQSGNPQNYRNNVQLKIKNGKIGFYKDKSDEIIPLPRNGCLILSEELNKYILNKNNKLTKDEKLRFSKKIDTYGSDISTFEILGKEIKIPANGFFQINRFLIAKWILEIKELIT